VGERAGRWVGRHDRQTVEQAGRPAPHPHALHTSPHCSIVGVTVGIFQALFNSLARMSVRALRWVGRWARWWASGCAWQLMRGAWLATLARTTALCCQVPQPLCSQSRVRVQC